MLIRRVGLPSETSDPIIPGTTLFRVHVLAPAKINLHLEILGQRPDGYHAIETLMLAVGLYDEITIGPGEGVTLACDDPRLTVGPDNLILRAAALLRKATGENRGASIGLTKRIPWAAGLGGGSSDAAAALAGLNEFWQLGLSNDRLVGMAAELGSDVPFFFHSPAAFCTGRGELATTTPVGKAFDFVLVMPPFGLNTAEVYREYRNTATPGGVRDPRDALKALAEGDVEALGQALHNRLQGPAMSIAPAIAEIDRRLEALGVAGRLMTGSGSCLFALCRNEREAARVADDLHRGWPPPHELARIRVFTVQSCV